MQNHPLTPMTDPNLVRVLQAQTRRRVGLIDHKAVAQGEAAIRARIDALRAAGHRRGHRRCGVERRPAAPGPVPSRACRWSPPARAWPSGFRRNFGTGAFAEASRPAAGTGLQAVVSGSCSDRHQQAGRTFHRGRPARLRDRPAAARAGEDVAPQALAWAAALAGARAGAGLFDGRAPEAVRAVQAAARRRGGRRHGRALHCRALPRGLVQRGVRQLVVAGGETSGACVQALGITQMRIGPQIDPGVPWCHAVSESGLHLTLKSGNFGGTTSSPKRFTVLAMNEAVRPRRDLPRRPKSLFERGYVHATAGNISVRLDDGFLITPTDACLGNLDPARLARLDVRRPADWRRPRQQDAGAAPPDLWGRQRFDPARRAA
jgi:hypothetical protein